MAEPNAAAWTIDQLSQLVAEVLSADHPGQPNGRIREVPDVRTLRWYTSIGLLDRPAAMRGRTGLYGRRHLAQIVAVKRLQADGLTLAEVQQRLIGADDAVLERIARVADVPDPTRQAASSATSSAVGSAASKRTAPRPPAESVVEPVGESAVEAESARSRFWSARPIQTATDTASRRPSAPHPMSSTPATGAASSALFHGIRLAPDVALLLDTPGAAPDDEGLAVIAQAAQPLLDALRALGLSNEQRRTGQKPSEGGQSR